MFLIPPSGLNQNTLKVWEVLKPLNIVELYSKKSLDAFNIMDSFNPNIDIQMVRSITSIYIGQVDQFGRPHGLGRQINTRMSSIYEGEFQSGLYHGIGRFIWNAPKPAKHSNRIPMETYTGIWNFGKRHGLGEQHTREGRRIKAYYKNDQVDIFVSKV